MKLDARIISNAWLWNSTTWIFNKRYLVLQFKHDCVFILWINYCSYVRFYILFLQKCTHKNIFIIITQNDFCKKQHWPYTNIFKFKWMLTHIIICKSCLDLRCDIYTAYTCLYNFNIDHFLRSIFSWKHENRYIIILISQ